MDVRSIEEVDLYLDFDPVLDTRFGANEAKYVVYGMMTPGVPERYELIVAEQNLNASGAGRVDDTLAGRNHGAIYIRDDADVVDQLQVQVDGRTVVDNINDAMILDATRLLNRIEQAAGGYLEVSLIEAAIIAEAVNNTVELQANFTGAGVLEVTAFRANFQGVNAAASIQRVRRWLATQQSQSVDASALPPGAVVTGA